MVSTRNQTKKEPEKGLGAPKLVKKSKKSAKKSSPKQKKRDQKGEFKRQQQGMSTYRIFWDFGFIRICHIRLLTEKSRNFG